VNRSQIDARTAWHPEAEKEAAEAGDWYAARSDSAGERFPDQLDKVITRLVASPKQFPVAGYNARRALLPDFPYAVIFRETSDKIQIVAIAHGKRRPGYWRKRTF
jgi:plasmid stabilization system protein ParE